MIQIIRIIVYSLISRFYIKILKVSNKKFKQILDILSPIYKLLLS